MHSCNHLTCFYPFDEYECVEIRQYVDRRSLKQGRYVFTNYLQTFFTATACYHLNHLWANNWYLLSISYIVLRLPFRRRSRMCWDLLIIALHSTSLEFYGPLPSSTISEDDASLVEESKEENNYLSTRLSLYESFLTNLMTPSVVGGCPLEVRRGLFLFQYPTGQL